MKKQKKKPILYQKYKQDQEIQVVIPGKRGKNKKVNRAKGIGGLITGVILIVLIILAAIGTVALSQPQIRILLQEILRY